ncbi:MAG: PQQ-binding-like beta-propeller repeat protein [Gemmatimonadaceae bacterium]
MTRTDLTGKSQLCLHRGRVCAIAALVACGGCNSSTGDGKADLPLIWHLSSNANTNSYWLEGAPSVANGSLYLEDGNQVWAVATASGTALWKTQVKDFPLPGARNIVTRNGQVFISEVDSVTAMRANDGSVAWRFHPDSNAALVGISADDRAVYTGQRGIPVVYALSELDGSLLWRVNVGQGWTTPAFVTGVAVSGDTVYAGVSRWINQNGGLRAGVIVALNRVTGAELWRYQTPGQGDDSQNVPLVVDDALIVNDFYGGAVIALDRATGQERWRVASEGAGFGPIASAVANGGHLYVASADAYVYDISLATGQVYWRQNTGTSLDGVAFCGGSVWATNGHLERRSATDGALTGHSLNGDALFTSSLASDGQNVYVTGYGGVYSFRC